MSLNLSKASKVVRVSNAVAAGQTTINSSSVDMKSFDGCEFEIHFGAIVSGAATSVKLQTSSDDSTFNDLEGSSQTVGDTDDNKIFRIDIVHPRERYLRVTVLRATQNSTVDSIVARQYMPKDQPITDDSSVAGSELLVASPEGTA